MPKPLDVDVDVDEREGVKLPAVEDREALAMIEEWVVVEEDGAEELEEVKAVEVDNDGAV